MAIPPFGWVAGRGKCRASSRVFEDVAMYLLKGSRSAQGINIALDRLSSLVIWFLLRKALFKRSDGRGTSHVN